MKSIKTITISVPIDMANEMQEVATEEQRTLSELLRETFRSYRARKHLYNLAQLGKVQTKKLGLKPEDFGCNEC